ncbi:MAG: aldose epimerase [Corynebacterium glucuronolyticum]|nr:aldose epimerase [Mycobacteriaceae bacterium]MDY5833908.1 aldose epimerase [Corynebacterium glucuronolyticum]
MTNPGNALPTALTCTEQGRTSMAIADGRAHLLSADSHLDELLYLSPEADFSEGGSIRGGVPIIAPWFNDLTGQEPAHGWARRQPWECQEVPGGFDCRIRHDEWDLRLGIQTTPKGFAMILKCRNAASKRRNVQLAFHPYFRVEDVTTVTVEGYSFDGSAVDERTTATSPVTFTDGSRRITVTGHDHDHTVIWNPGTAVPGDMPIEDWKKFVCVEPALLGEDVTKGVSLAPWEWTQIGMTVKVEEA